MTDAVRVAVRARPMSARERAEGSREALEVLEEVNQVTISHLSFTFDEVFDKTASQEAVYDACAAPLVDKIFSGFNCTLIAYGQTGSGKTYTMGTEETLASLEKVERGIIPRIVDAIFQRTIEKSEDFTVTVSMLEVYEEKVHDLLSSSREPLPIREKNGVAYVQGLTTEPVSDLISTMCALERGGRMRSKGGTAMNASSSRSHALFTLIVRKTPSSENDASFSSKLCIVDLAGSERLKKTRAEGERMREGIMINSGLLALGNVISALVECGPNSGHIPYRDSKITRLLQESLGGNSFTVMIACVSPADTNGEETCSTLRYADRAKKIKNKPVVNVDPKLALIRQLREENEALRHELAIYRTGEQSILVADGCTSAKCATELEESERALRKMTEERNRVEMKRAETEAENGLLLRQSYLFEQEMSRLREMLENARRLIKEKVDSGVDLEEVMDVLNATEQGQDLTFDDVLETTEKAGAEEQEEIDDQLCPERFAESHAKLTKEMHRLVLEIRNKEREREVTEASHAELQKIQEEHAAELEELNVRMQALEREKAELLAKLRGTSANHKLSEERRKRLRELERELSESKRRIGALSKYEQNNKVLQDKMKKQALELQDMKKLCARLGKQIKVEEVKFRSWKAKSEREMAQMASRERRREAEVARTKEISRQQLAVYRRKYEEASACNRRLQEQLHARARREKENQPGVQFAALLDEELALAFSSQEAQVHCNTLIEQRKNLTSRLRKLKAQLKKLSEQPPAKRRTGDQGSSFDNEAECRRVEEEIVNLEQEIELRGTELREIQSRCASADEGAREEKRWKHIYTVANAKAALKRIFEAAVNEHRDAFEKERAIEDLRRSASELRQKADEMKREFESAIEKQQLENEDLRKILALKDCDHAKTVLSVLSSRSNIPDDVLKKIQTAQDAQEKIIALENELKELRESMAHSENRRRTRTLKKRSAGDAERVPLSVQQSSNACIAAVDLFMDDDSITEVEDKNDYTYYPTPEVRKQRTLVTRMPAPENRRESYLIYRELPTNASSEENSADNANSSERKSPLEQAACNSTFTVQNEDDDDRLPKSILSMKKLTRNHLSKALTKNLFKGLPE